MLLPGIQGWAERPPDGPQPHQALLLGLLSVSRPSRLVRSLLPGLKTYTSKLSEHDTSLEAPLKEVRLWASSDLAGDAAILIRHLVVRGEMSSLFRYTC